MKNISFSRFEAFCLAFEENGKLESIHVVFSLSYSELATLRRRI